MSLLPLLLSLLLAVVVWGTAAAVAAYPTPAVCSLIDPVAFTVAARPGLCSSTVWLFLADNGGMPSEGGFNVPLVRPFCLLCRHLCTSLSAWVGAACGTRKQRGHKATVFAPTNISVCFECWFQKYSGEVDTHSC